MHQYIQKCGAPQPPATVKQMAPIQGQMNPRLLEQAVREMQQRNERPMSSNDGVNIYIQDQPGDVTASNYEDAYSQQANAFSQSQLGQTLSDRMAINDPSEYVQQRSQDMLGEMLRQAYMS